MKTPFSLLLLGLVIFLSACQKEYTCVCQSSSKGSLNIFERIKTTKLGKKGLNKTCLSHQDSNPDMVNCHLE